MIAIFVADWIVDRSKLMRGVTQSLIRLLFIIIILDLEEEINGKGWEGVGVSKGKIRMLAADDTVFMVDHEEGMAGLNTELKKYQGGNRFDPHTEKT